MSDANEVAEWNIELMCSCPGCASYIDLFSLPYFTDAMSDGLFQAFEHDTEQTKGFELDCPECGKAFKVDFSY